MNDKCAAGTGRFVDVMMRTLEENIANIDGFVEDRNPVSISSMCTVFAESEIISLLAKDIHRGDIALGIIHSICKRTASFAQKLNFQGDVFFSGGLAYRFIKSSRGMACIEYKNTLGNPTIFSKKYENELLSLKGDIGGKFIMKKHLDDLEKVTVSQEIELMDIDILSLIHI